MKPRWAPSSPQPWSSTPTGAAVTAARKAANEPQRSTSPSSQIQTFSAPPAATRSNGSTRPLVKVTPGSWARHATGRHDQRAT